MLTLSSPNSQDMNMNTHTQPPTHLIDYKQNYAGFPQKQTRCSAQWFWKYISFIWQLWITLKHTMVALQFSVNISTILADDIRY